MLIFPLLGVEACDNERFVFFSLKSAKHNQLEPIVNTVVLIAVLSYLSI